MARELGEQGVGAKFVRAAVRNMDHAPLGLQGEAEEELFLEPQRLVTPLIQVDGEGRFQIGRAMERGVSSIVGKPQKRYIFLSE